MTGQGHATQHHTMSGGTLVSIHSPLPELPGLSRHCPDPLWHGRVRVADANAGEAACHGPNPLALAFCLVFHE